MGMCYFAVSHSLLYHLGQPIWLRFKQVSVQLPTLAVNETLLAFVAERRADAPLLLGACS